MGSTMKQTAVVVAPGRGTYNAPELGYLNRHHANRPDLLAAFDEFRTGEGQATLTELDSAERFTIREHTRGDNAAALIHACAYLDYLSIDENKFDILGVTGNSMGWYIALTCADALGPIDGFRTVNSMGTLMQKAMIGGQLVYPFVDENWRPIPDMRDTILAKVADIAARPDHELYLSIDLGGMLVLAGNSAGLKAFEGEMPLLQDRFPIRLPNHAAFHTPMQAPVANEGKRLLRAEAYRQPDVAMIDGRGAIWHPKSCNPADLWSYTLGHQVVAPYDFTAAIRTAARELMPDVFIVLGPGTTLGGAVAQSLVLSSWRGWRDKAGFKKAQSDAPRLLSMGHDDQRTLVVAG